PVGPADGRAERDQHDRRQWQRHGEPGVGLHEDQRGEGDLPGQQRRQELAGAYSPLTNAIYMPMQNMCMTATTTVDTRDPSKVYGLNMQQQLAPGADKVGTVWAISVETGATLWKYEQRAGMLSLVATGGGLVFGGHVNGRFK